MKLIENGRKLNEKDIGVIENVLNLEFTKDYREILINTNGGIPEVEVEFNFVEKSTSGNEVYEQGSDIHYFFNNDELLESYDNLTTEQLIRNFYVPIACDSFGNVILICLDKKSNYGSVFFANHESINPNDSYWDLSKIAESFTEFIDKLKPLES